MWLKEMHVGATWPRDELVMVDLGWQRDWIKGCPGMYFHRAAGTGPVLLLLKGKPR